MLSIWFRLVARFVTAWPSDSKFNILLLSLSLLALRVLPFPRANSQGLRTYSAFAYFLSDCFFRINRYREAQTCFQFYFNATEPERLQARHYFIDGRNLTSFGELALQTDTFLKSIYLGFWDNYLNKKSKEKKIICIWPKNREPPNMALRKLWEDHLEFIEEDSDSHLPTGYHILKSRWLPVFGKCHDYVLLQHFIAQEWRARSKPPLLSVNESSSIYCKKILKDLGIFDMQRVVTLHIAENDDYHRCRRVEDPMTYVPAIRYLSNNGFTVVRIGRKNHPIMECRGLVDVSALGFQDSLDLYLLSHCFFAIVSASGPNSVPAVFGTPSLWTNIWPWIVPVLESDLVIYKRPTKDGLQYTPKEILARLKLCHSSARLKSLKISLIDNDEIDLTEAVKEMLNRLLHKSFSKTRAQDSFEKIRLDDGLLPSRSSICDSFWIRHYLETEAQIKD